MKVLAFVLGSKLTNHWGIVLAFFVYIHFVPNLKFGAKVYIFINVRKTAQSDCLRIFFWRAHTDLTNLTDFSSLQATGILILPLSKNSEGVKNPWDQWDQCGEIQHSSLCSQGFYHKPFEARLIAAVHRAGIVGIGLVILLFHVVKIIHYLHHLVFGAVMLLQRRTKQAVGLGMTGITLLDMLDWILIHVASHL